jgi:hypothetical protein
LVATSHPSAQAHSVPGHLLFSTWLELQFSLFSSAFPDYRIRTPKTCLLPRLNPPSIFSCALVIYNPLLSVRIEPHCVQAPFVA